MPVQVAVRKNRVSLGKWFRVTFERTLRIPDDGRTYPLPPGLGSFPVRRAADFPDAVPAEWVERGDLFIPMFQREALWMLFDGEPWHPSVVQVGVGGINAVSGTAWDDARLSAEPQNYVVCPDQPWLDGINAGDGFIRQFVAMPLGSGLTVEAQLTGREEVGGIQLRVWEPKPGRFPDRAPRRTGSDFQPMMGGMGLAAGGKMQQKIYPDEYGWDTWDTTSSRSVVVHIVNSVEYRALTGRRPPATPIDARTYTEHGLPWFALYDERQGDVPASPRLSKVRSVGELDAAHDEPLEVSPEQVKKLKLP
jgi:hypothetical protein